MVIYKLYEKIPSRKIPSRYIVPKFIPSKYGIYSIYRLIVTFSLIPTFFGDFMLNNLSK